MMTLSGPHPKRRTALLATAIFLAVAGLAILSAVESAKGFTDLNQDFAQGLQAIDIPGISAAEGFALFATGVPAILTFWLLLTGFLVLRGRPLEALAVFFIIAVWPANEIAGTVLDRTFGLLDLDGAVGASNTGGEEFPDRCVALAVAFYGFVAFLTIDNLRRSNLSVFTTALAAVIIGLTLVTSKYGSAHWPGDVLGSYLAAFIGVTGVAWVYTSVKEDRFHLPKRGNKQRPILPDGLTIAGSIASTVYLDQGRGIATKEYNPPWPVRTLYWLAFQAPFPYQGRKDALEASAAKRKIAGLLTKHQYGHDMVAAVYDIHDDGERYSLVTELVVGAAPQSNSEIAGNLSELYGYFQDVGLPTWQIAPGNPHAYSNFIRAQDGGLKLIDLESSLVSFSPPFRQLLSALRDGNYPVFDDVDFRQLQSYVTANESELASSLGTTGLGELNEAIENAERSSFIWKQSEPRIWGRIARRSYRVLDMSPYIQKIRRGFNSAEALARGFLESAVDVWEQEGRLDDLRAAELRCSALTPEVTEAMKHMGAHVFLTLAIAVPIPGLRSLARFAWTLAFRVKARYALARRRISLDEYRLASSIHTGPVMLLSLVPIFGAAAYAVSDPIVKKGLRRILVDQSTRRLPFRLYWRLGLERITAPPVPTTTGGTGVSTNRVIERLGQVREMAGPGLQYAQLAGPRTDCEAVKAQALS